MSGASLGSVGESRSRAAPQLCCPRTGTRGSVAAPGLGLEAGKDSQCLRAVNPRKQSGCYCCWKIKWSCKLSGRAFTFTHLFPVWSTPKGRTWKSAYGEGETCIYSIKSRLHGEISDVNSSVTVLVYLMWCDSAEATAPLDWFILAASLTQSEFCLLLFC